MNDDLDNFFIRSGRFDRDKAKHCYVSSQKTSPLRHMYSWHMLFINAQTYESEPTFVVC